jgi:short-subunit dehydrogenase
LRPEAARRGVGVTVLCPGAVDTPILDARPVRGLSSVPSLPSVGGRPLTGRQYMATAGMPLMDADEFARRALRGIARNRSVVMVGSTVRAMDLADRLAPSLVDRVNVYMAAKLARAMEQAEVITIP